MTLTLYNTLTRRKEPFRPIDAKNVRMYVCGPTVYDFAHIGNARPVIVFDVLFRLLRHIYGAEHVTYARNITDVDDKINARAAEQYSGMFLNDAIRKVTEETARQFHEDIRALGVLMPEDVNRPGQPPVFVEPRATESIPEMRKLIEMLVGNKHAYVAQNHVLFDVSSMPDYGRLANRSLEEMEAGARVDVAPYKKGAMDFVLWKPSKQAGVDGSNYSEPAWPSPCGIKKPGRPGWHIECSAMAAKHLGETFDIHGGGIDLVFPHHENEIAQTLCAYGVEVMATNWMHNGFLQVEGEKMSKSLGNFVTINELLHEWPGEVLRLNMLRTHYRQPINWTKSSLEESAEELWRWATHIQSNRGEDRGYMRAVTRQQNEPSQSVVEALADDLNTPAAITALRALAKRAVSDEAAAGELLENCEFLGLLRHNQLGAHERGAPYSAPVGTGPGLAWKHYDAVQKLRVAHANQRISQKERLIREIETDGLTVNIDPEGHVSLQMPEAQEAESRRKIGELVSARNAARKAKDFKEADRIRDELSAMGIQLKDAKDPATGEIATTWEVKR